MLGSHRENGHFSRAQWKKRVILPCWTIQVLILLSLMGLFSFRLSRTVETWEEERNKGEVPVVELVWEIGNIAFSLISVAIILSGIARYIAEVLTPLPLLFGCILNLVLAGVVLALDVVIYVRRQDKKYSITGLALDITLIVVTVIPLIYAIIIYRRLLSYDDYHLPGNHKAFGFAGMGEDMEDRLVRRQHRRRASDVSSFEPDTTRVVRGESQTRSRSVSLENRRPLSSHGGYASPSARPPSPPGSPGLPGSAHDLRPSYDHKRDTQFEAYVARRLSQGGYFEDTSFREDVRRALGDGFGFSDLMSSGNSGGQINTKAEMSSAGAVQAAHSPPRTNSLGRRPNSEPSVSGGNGTIGYGPVRKIATPPRRSLQRGRSLNSVPEAQEEDYQGGVNIPSGSQHRSFSHGDVGTRNGRGSPVRMGPVEGFENVELGAKKQSEGHDTGEEAKGKKRETDR